jgi:hypothetical protein
MISVINYLVVTKVRERPSVTYINENTKVKYGDIKGGGIKKQSELKKVKELLIFGKHR